MKTFLTYAGTALAALAASVCCWIPALLGAGAAGSLGISAALAPWRPYLLALTGLFLLGGFWMVYRKPKADCCDSGGCRTPATAGSPLPRFLFSPASRQVCRVPALPVQRPQGSGSFEGVANEKIRSSFEDCRSYLDERRPSFEDCRPYVAVR